MRTFQIPDTYRSSVISKIKTERKEDDDHPAYIIGRCGKIIVDGKEIGQIGEIAPRVLKNWRIKVPGVAFEIETDFLIK